MPGTARGDGPARRLTVRGVRTKARIVSAAADLMRVKGVDATTMDDVRAASGTSKSQIYHHYRDKNELVRDVIEFVGEQVIHREQDRLGRVSTLNGLRRWRDALVQANDLQHGAYGCALGSLAGDVADHDQVARAALQRLFRAWGDLIAEALGRMRDQGLLKPDADLDYLADGLLAALQGGYLLAQTAGDSSPMARALDMSLDYIATLSPTSR
jgi:TetR/AcrR family transcriptional repressor of nem operon